MQRIVLTTLGKEPRNSEKEQDKRFYPHRNTLLGISLRLGSLPSKFSFWIGRYQACVTAPIYVEYNVVGYCESLIPHKKYGTSCGNV